MFKKITLKYQIGFLIVILIGLMIYILRSLTLSSSEIAVIAAVLGGFISGGLTLIGVRATLDNQYKKEFIDLYPKRKMLLDEQVEEMNKIIKFIEYSVSEVSGNISYSEFGVQYEQKYSGFYAYIKNSIVINGQVYDRAKKFQKHLGEIKECIGPKLKQVDAISGEETLFGTCVNSGKKEAYDMHLKNLKNFSLEINAQMESFDRKYEKLTGM